MSPTYIRAEWIHGFEAERYATKSIEIFKDGRNS
jgi:hypothetical protein